MPISVCIPTFRRPELLKTALTSTFSNDVRPLEIVISDDDYSEAQAEAILGLPRPDGVTVRYIPNQNARGQSGNVNCAFAAASHERIVLLHDDDYLLPGGLDRLDAAWRAYGGEVDAVYGRQKICDHDGRMLEEQTRVSLRNRYLTDEYIGQTNDRLWAALVRQFHNNSMMIRRSLAMTVGYPYEKEVGRSPVDLFFGVRYALAAERPYIVLGDYVSVYRNTHESVFAQASIYPVDYHLAYQEIARIRAQETHVVEALERLRKQWASQAFWGYLHHDRPLKALGVYWTNRSTLRRGRTRGLMLPLRAVAAMLGVRPYHRQGVRDKRAIGWLPRMRPSVDIAQNSAD